jgi:predicted nuclease of predicted toxin-antitoxin system
MKLKLDENLGNRQAQMFRVAGHDVLTVRDQGLQSGSDSTIFDVCCTEQRCLITLDLDFANVLRFPPADSAGIIVLRFPDRGTMLLLDSLVDNALNALQALSPQGRLWIVEPSRIRIHQSEPED